MIQHHVYVCLVIIQGSLIDSRFVKTSNVLNGLLTEIEVTLQSKDGDARFTTIPLKHLPDELCGIY